MYPHWRYQYLLSRLEATPSQHPNESLPLKLNGATVGDTVAVATDIYCTCMTTIVICCNSAAESVLCVCGLVACIGAGEWMPGTINANLSNFPFEYVGGV